jgi:copper transport protein
VTEVARRLSAHLAAAGLLVALGLLVTAPAASAHATLVSSDPADGAVVARAPARVSATFDEAVGVSAGSLRVFAPNGARVDTGGTVHGSKPQQITVALVGGLGRGTYTVGWHVISADSHPVQGAFTFSVGAPSSTAVNSATLRPPVSRVVGVVFGVVRFLAFCSFALLIGAVAFVIWCWPAGATRPVMMRLAIGAWGGLALSVLAAVLLQGVYGAGQGIGRVFWPNVLHATLYSRYGRALGIRLLLVIAALFAFTITLDGLAATSRRARITAGAAWGAVTAALAGTWAMADHAGTGIQVPLAVPADIIHLSAMATWLGGLVVLATIVLRRPRQRGPGSAGKAARRRGEAATAEAAQAVTRFSPIALMCVVAILVTGTYMAWRGVGTLGALTGTVYGRLVLVKIAGLCALICLGYLARRRIAEGLRVPAADTHAAAAEPDVRVKASVRAGPAKVSAGAPRGRGAAGNGATAGRAHAGNGARPGRGRTGGSVRVTGPATAPPTGPVTGGGKDSGSKDNRAGPDTGHMGVTLRRLRWSVAVETAIAAAVLSVTAVLVNTPTARESYFPLARATVAFDTGGPGGRGSIAVTVTPARLGPNQIRLSITGNRAAPYRPQQIQAALSLPARHLGPLPVRLTSSSPGHYISDPVVLSTSGRWQLTITVRSDAFDEAAVTVPFSLH